MSILKGLKAGTSVITATFTDGGVTKTAKATLTVSQAAGNISYTMHNASLYCTDTAASTSSTDAVKYASVSSGATSSTGTVSCTISVKNSSNSTVSGWSINSNGTTITIPSGTPAGAYTVSVTATAATNAGYYDSASTTQTATITVVATSISSYGAVSTPSISQKTDFPAGGVTITSSNVTTYFTGGSSSQTITYNNGQTRSGSISYAWSGSATVSNLETTKKDNRTPITINTLTYTATGEGSKSASSSVSSGYQSANVEGSTHYKNTSGTVGDNWTYGTPSAVVVSGTDGMVQHGGSCTLSSTVTDTKQYYLRWTSGSYKSHTEYPSGTVGFEITSVSKNSGNADYTLSGAVLTHRDMRTFVGKDTVTVQSYNTKDTSKKGTSKSWGIQNDRTKVWDGYKTYGTPVAIAVSGSDTISAAGGSCTVTSSVTNVRYWHYEYTDSHHNEAANTRSEDVAGIVKWVISSESTAISGDRWGALSSTSGNSTKVSHSSMTNAVGTDSLTLEAQNSLDTTKKVSKSWSVTNSLGSTKYKNTSGTEGRNITAWGTPAKITTSGSYTAAGGSCTYSSSVTNSTSWYQRYTSGTYTSLQAGTETGTVKWVIASETTGTAGADRWSALSASTGNSSKITHSNMTTYVATDTIVVEAQNNNDTTKKADAISLSVSNSLTWSSPVISHTSPISLEVSGQTYTMSPTITQSGSYTSGSSASNTSADYSYAVKTSVSGYSLSSGKVTVSNNNTASARNGYTVTITATANGKSSTKDVVFNQVAGSKKYETPAITGYRYDVFAASGESKTPASVTYTQVWTWNGVPSSGGTLTSGGTLAYTTTGDLPSGFATATGFATTGSVVWANRTTVVGAARSAKSNLKVAVTMNGLTSATYTCKSCDQAANELVGLSLTLNPETIKYGATSVPTATATYTSGSTKNVSDLATYTSSDSNVAKVE